MKTHHQTMNSWLLPAYIVFYQLFFNVKDYAVHDMCTTERVWAKRTFEKGFTSSQCEGTRAEYNLFNVNMLEKYKHKTIVLFWYTQLTKELGVSIARLRNWAKLNNFPNQLPNSGKMIGRGKDYDASSHLHPFAKVVGSYMHKII